jgi:hypothetical protein
MRNLHEKCNVFLASLAEQRHIVEGGDSSVNLGTIDCALDRFFSLSISDFQIDRS